MTVSIPLKSTQHLFKLTQEFLVLYFLDAFYPVPLTALLRHISALPLLLLYAHWLQPLLFCPLPIWLIILALPHRLFIFIFCDSRFRIFWKRILGRFLSQLFMNQTALLLFLGFTHRPILGGASLWWAPDWWNRGCLLSWWWEKLGRQLKVVRTKEVEGLLSWSCLHRVLVQFGF